MAIALAGCTVVNPPGLLVRLREGATHGDRLRNRSAGPGMAGMAGLRFACWERADSATGLERRVDACADTRSPLALGNRRCWEGVVHSKDGSQIRLAHGYLKRSQIPIGRIAWVDYPGPLLTANIQIDTIVDTYKVAPELEAELYDKLLLLTVAVAWWENASTSD